MNCPFSVYLLSSYNTLNFIILDIYQNTSCEILSDPEFEVQSRILKGLPMAADG